MPEGPRGQSHAARRQPRTQRHTESAIALSEIIERFGRRLPPLGQITDLTLEVVFHERPYTMPGLAVLLRRFDRLWADLVQLLAYGEQRDTVPTAAKVPRPLIRRVSLNSPLTLVIGGPSALVASLLLLRYLLRNPKAIGTFVPEMVQSWHESWTQAERAKADRVLARTLQAERDPAVPVMPVMLDSPSEEMVERVVRDAEALLEVAEPAKAEVSANATPPEDD